MGISNQFTWSKTRNATFEECPRKYRLHYYDYWDGWLDSAPDTARRLYKLRSLVSVPAWVGTVTHDTISWLLQYMRDGVAAPALSKVLAYARKRIDDNWQYSVDRRYWSDRKARNPDWFGLIEHELGLFESVVHESTVPHRAYLQAANCLINLWESDIFARILASDRNKWMRIDDRSFFYLDGVKIWSVPDFMYTRDDGVVEIIDWKTGKQGDNDMEQLAAYAAFARIEHEVPIENIQATLAYLKGDDVHVVTARTDMALIQSFAVNARASMARMTEVLEPKGDVETTRKANNPLPVLQFPKTDHVYKCKRCNFRDECWPTGIINAAA